MRTLRAPTVVKFSQSFLLDRSFLLFTPAVRNDRPRITTNAPKEENTASWCRYGGLFEPLSFNNDLGLYLEEHSCFPNCVSETSKNNADERMYLRVHIREKEKEKDLVRSDIDRPVRSDKFLVKTIDLVFYCFFAKYIFLSIRNPPLFIFNTFVYVFTYDTRRPS